VRIAILNWRDREHPRAGGAEVFVHEVAQRWAASGHEVTLVCSRPHGVSARSDIDGFAISRVGRISTGGHHARAPRLACRSGADVILESINTIPYWLPLRNRSTPSATLVHQMAVDVWDSHLPRAAASLARKAERAAFRPYRRHPVLAVSESTADDLRSCGLTEVEVVPQGGIGRQRTFDKEKVPTLIFVGRLAANKRPDDAIEAFTDISKRIPDAKMWIVGDGPLRAALAGRLPNGAHLLGRLARSELLEHMSRAHLLMAPSVREGWGLVVTEANALGTPAVGYAVPGLKDAIRQETTGVLVPPNPDALATACVDLLLDSRRYETLRRGAVRWGEQFTWDLTADRVLGALQDVVSSNHLSDRKSA
jgi:glycosyltransferase involved in cell wall biosynthesis